MEGETVPLVEWQKAVNQSARLQLEAKAREDDLRLQLEQAREHAATLQRELDQWRQGCSSTTVDPPRIRAEATAEPDRANCDHCCGNQSDHERGCPAQPPLRTRAEVADETLETLQSYITVGETSDDSSPLSGLWLRLEELAGEMTRPTLPRVELTGEERAVLEACAAMTLEYPSVRPRPPAPMVKVPKAGVMRVVEAELARRAARKEHCAKMTGRARPCPVHDAQPPLPTECEDCNETKRPRIADMTNAWFCPQCGLRDETARGIDQDGTCSSCGSYCCTWDSVRGHLAHYGWEVVSADDVGATTALHRRIEELTAELQKEKDRRVEVRRSNQDLNEVVHALTKDLATERAAREMAEKAREVAAQFNRGLLESRQRAERERDTALARVKELETALQAARIVTESHRELAAETALASAQHRIAELEAYGNDCCARAVSGAVGNHLHRIAQLETALASARKLLVRADRYIEQQPHDYGAGLRRDIRALLWPDVGLTSHPSPAPCSGCAAARELLESVKDHMSTELWKGCRADISAWLEEHPAPTDPAEASRRETGDW